MRPLELEMEFIGPFVRKTLIDFRRFGENSLFLITGKTGSGKSFIFDAMCFALYGATPSGREDNLSSDYKREGDRPFIRFKFQIGDRLYEIGRTLPYAEARKRGSGATERKETQTLTWLNPPQGGNQVLATKKLEVKEKCEELLSLKLDQFSKVMLIPQGEFRELLKADTERREPLLRQLFRSDMYTDITATMDEMHKRANGHYLDLKKETDIVIGQLLEMLPEGSVIPEGSSSMEAITAFRASIEKELPDRRAEVDGLSSGYESSRQRTAWMREVIGSNKELAGSIGRRDALGSIAKERIDPLKSRLERHTIAIELRPLIERSEDKDAHIQRTERTIRALDEELKGARKVLEERKMDESKVPGLKERHERILRKESRIADLLSDLARIKELKEQLADADRERSRLVDGQRTLQGTHDKALARMAEIDRRIGALGKNIIDVQKAEASRTVGKDLINVLREIDSQRPDIEDMRSKIKEGKRRVATLERELKRKKALREVSLSAELSSSLKAGLPCPVCGSKDHPSPAKQSKRFVSREDLERAEYDLRKGKEELERLALKGSELQTGFNGLSVRARQMVKEHKEFKGMNVPTLQTTVGKIEEDIKAEKRRTTDLGELQNGLLKMNGEMQSLLERKERISLGIKEAETTIRAMSSNLEERSKRVETLNEDISDLIKVDDEAALSEGLKALQREKAELPGRIEGILNDLREAERNAHSVEDRQRSQKADLAALRSEKDDLEKDLSLTLSTERFSTFKDISEVKDSILPSDRLAKMSKEIEEHVENVTRLEGMIAQIRKDLEDRLSGHPVPSDEALDLQMKEENVKKARLDEASSILSRKARDLEEVDRRLSQISKVAKEMADMEPRLAILRDLSAQVKGLAVPRISLERFFLAQRFEEVLIEANQRLQRLSENRFVLKRASEDEAGARSKAGLDLLVFDNYTGLERPANTLSGGQMFLASLALALGLADVVQARSGGIKMEALFIDEGFGSLDEDALQLALKVLSELRKGRTVGVISHVQELKKQIPFQIEVSSSREGSTIEIRA